MKRLLFAMLFTLFTKPSYAIENYLIKNDNSDELIIGLLGLGMDYNQMLPFIKDENVLFLYDYSNLDFEFDFTPYKNIKLFAYSAGVMATSLIQDKLPKNISKSVAINGVYKLFDNEKGLNDEILSTMYGLDENNYIEFRKKYLVNSEIELEKFNQSPPLRSFDSFFKELDALIGYDNGKKPKPYVFDKVFISNNDNTIPFKNQLKAWEDTKTPYQIIETNHFPFYHFESIKDWFN
ncbi:MAG: hypothetical protein BWY78_00187 [Alphaproteobacteria bacterium ADurb.Bin438]|nr:MAG: hypothetical protein BWY78_00187 [Alphaproteobacteria bacterium ADurb.Bin438]